MFSRRAKTRHNTPQHPHYENLYSPRYLFFLRTDYKGDIIPPASHSNPLVRFSYFLYEQTNGSRNSQTCSKTCRSYLHTLLALLLSRHNNLPNSGCRDENGGFREPERSVHILREHRKHRKTAFAGRQDRV